MTDKAEGIITGLAAMLVLATAMLEPWVSIGLAVAMLIGISVYKLLGKTPK